MVGVCFAGVTLISIAMAVDAVHQLQHVVIFSHGDLRKQMITAMLVVMKAMFLMMMMMMSVGRSVAGGSRRYEV